MDMHTFIILTNFTLRIWVFVTMFTSVFIKVITYSVVSFIPDGMMGALWLPSWIGLGKI